MTVSFGLLGASFKLYKPHMKQITRLRIHHLHKYNYRMSCHMGSIKKEEKNLSLKFQDFRWKVKCHE